MDTQTIICIIVMIAMCFAFVMWMLWQIKKRGLKEFTIDMIVKAEDMFQKGQNSEKMNFVIDRLLAKLPSPLSFFITRNIVEAFVQKIFDQIKIALDYRESEVK